MAKIVSNNDIFKDQKIYQNLSLNSMEKSVNLLTSIDTTLKSFANDLKKISLANIGNDISAEKEEKNLKLAIKSIIDTFQKLSKPILSVQKGFEKLYQTNFVQFFKGLVVQSYREFRDATKGITADLLKSSKELLSSGYKASKLFVKSKFESGKNKLLESGPGEFLTKKVSQFKEGLGILKEGSLSALQSEKNKLLESGPGKFLTKTVGDLKKFSERGLRPETDSKEGTLSALQSGKNKLLESGPGEFLTKKVSQFKATDEEKKPKISALKGIKETLEETLNFWKRLVDKSDDPGSKDAKPSLLSKIFNRKKGEGSSESSSESSKGKGSSGAAKIGGKLGGLIGGFIGSVLGNAIAGFVLAFGNPALFKAAGIFAVTLPLIGAGIGGFIAALGVLAKFGIDAISKTLPKLSRSLKTFESLDGNKLSKAAVGMKRFFNTFVSGALGGLLSNFTLPDPKNLENLGKSLKQFEELNAQNITNSSVALGGILESLGKASGFKFEQTDINKLTAFSGVLSSMDSNLNGDNLKKIGEGLKPIVDNTQNLGTIEYKVNEGSELGPLGQLGKDLSQFKDVKVDNIKNVGPAIEALGTTFKNMMEGEVWKTISDGLSKIFRVEQNSKSLSDQLNEMVTGFEAFERLDVDKMERIGPAIKSLGQGLKDASKGLKEDFLSTITSMFGTEDEGKKLVDNFTKLSELGEEDVAKRLTAAGLALQKFAFGLQTIGNTNFDNVANGLELIISKIRPLIIAMKNANFSPEDTLQGVAEGMKQFGEVTIPKESVALQGFLEAVGKGLNSWKFNEDLTKTLIELNNGRVLEHIAINAPKFKKFSQMDSTGLLTNFASLGAGLEQLADFINDGELTHLNELSKTGVLKQLSEVFRPDIREGSVLSDDTSGGQQKEEGSAAGQQRRRTGAGNETPSSLTGPSVEKLVDPAKNAVGQTVPTPLMGKLIDPAEMSIGQTVNMSKVSKDFVEASRAKYENILNSNKRFDKPMQPMAKLQLQRLNDGRLAVTKTEKGYDFGAVKPGTPKSQGTEGQQQQPVVVGGSTTGSYNSNNNNTTHNYFSKRDTDAVAGT